MQRDPGGQPPSGWICAGQIYGRPLWHRRDWTDYLAARKALTTQNVRPDPYPPNSR